MPTTITTIGTIAVAVSDQDRSTDFFVEKLGFEKQMDTEFAPGFRSIEVAPPESAMSISIVAVSDAMPAGVDTGIRFVTTDAEAERASMLESGVDVDELLRWPGVPVRFSFRDLDGNALYLAEPMA